MSLEDDLKSLLQDFAETLYSYQFDPDRFVFEKIYTNGTSFDAIRCMTKIASFLDQNEINYKVDSHSTFILDL